MRRAISRGMGRTSARRGSSYNARRGGYPPRRDRSSIGSGAERNSTSFHEASGGAVNALIASAEPPNVAGGEPPGPPGIGATANLPATRVSGGTFMIVTAYGQLRMKAALPF